MKRLLPMFPLAALLLLTTGVGPCDSKQLGSVQDCTYRGARFSVGSSWTATGATCASCTCATTGPVCKSVACGDAGTTPSGDAGTDLPLTCFDSAGNVFACPSDGGSNDGGADVPSGSCFDSSGAVVPCVDAGTATCSYGGLNYAAGSTFPSADGCNSCTCASSGMVACTGMVCAADAAAGACMYQGKSYPVGASIPAADGCNSCTCQQDGSLSCTLKACASDAGMDGATASCVFDATYVYGWVGGLQPFTDLITLAPPASYTIVRTPVSNNVSDSGSCAPPLPMCGTGDGKIIDVPSILADLGDPTVQLLLSLTTTQSITLGFRITPDDALFSFQRNGSAGFLVGSPCLGDAGGCTAIPDAVARLRTDLLALDKQQRMDAACAGPLSSGS